ncbi:MAG: histidine phosphatase family protein [Lachnospiraceae bacterium]|nr:histidine phosphatase family protein [Lachnospiraceae bacterium]
MKLIFIRHADPDYTIDSLTDKGKREAALLAKRVKNWDNISGYYCSPLGRARLTSEYCLKDKGIEPVVCDWLREFDVPVLGEHGETKHIPWDYMPEFWTQREELYNKDNWLDADIFKGSEIKARYRRVRDGIDGILSSYGYNRKGNLYVTDKENDDTTLVFFCHLGISYLIIGYLLGIAPFLLWHTFFVAPSAVTILGTEERQKGIASFRVQVYGDCSHLLMGGEPISRSGYYTDPFQG